MNLLKNVRLLRRCVPPKKIGHSSAVMIEIAAVAALLRNDMSGVFLTDTGGEAAQVLAMTMLADHALGGGHSRSRNGSPENLATPGDSVIR